MCTRSLFGTPIPSSHHQLTLALTRLLSAFPCSEQPRVVPHIPLGIIVCLLAALPTSEGGGRIRTLRACSLDDSTWRDIARAELPRHMQWAKLWPGKIDAFLTSPSYRNKEGWRCTSLALVRAPAEMMWAILSAASAVEELKLIGCDARDIYAGKYGEMPAGALNSFNGEWVGMVGGG